MILILISKLTLTFISFGEVARMFSLNPLTIKFLIPERGSSTFAIGVHVIPEMFLEVGHINSLMI